jgi:hypothetical protein
VQVSRRDLAAIWAACGRDPAITRLAVDATRLGADLDVQVEREQRGYVVTIMVVRGEQVVREQEFLVAWDQLDERVKLAVLAIYVGGLVLGVDRWRRRAALAEQAALAAAEARFGPLPDR